MKHLIPIISDQILSDENYGCLINGELHIAPALYDRMHNEPEFDYALFENLDVVDIDEMVYIERIDELLIFSGQQVKVYDNGSYVGDGTVTSYPHKMHFEKAEITMHFPFKKEVAVCSITDIIPII